MPRENKGSTEEEKEERGFSILGCMARNGLIKKVALRESSEASEVKGQMET